MLKIAYLISAYTDPAHLATFVGSLARSADCYVHVDARVDQTPFERATKGLSVRFLADRLRVAWGSFRQVEYQMRLLREALTSGTRYDYLFILSAQDYPVWSNERIDSFLTSHPGRNFIQGIRMDCQPERITRPYRQYYPFNNHCLRPGSPASKLRVATRRLCTAVAHKPLTFRADGRNYTLYKGSDYFALTADTARYALDEWDRSRELRRYFETGFAPSETFMHTLLFNSPLAPSCILSEGTYRSLADLTPLTYIDYEPVIRILTAADYPAIVRADKMFCRKVVTGQSDELVALLEQRRTQEAADLSHTRQA